MAIINKTLCLILIPIFLSSCWKNENKMRNVYNSPKPREALRQKPCSFAKVIGVKYQYDPNGSCWTIDMKIRNESDTILFVTDVPSGCSCFHAQFSKTPVAKHGTINIKAVYKTGNHEKGFTKSITVIFNNGRYYKMILLRPRQKTRIA